MHPNLINEWSTNARRRRLTQLLSLDCLVSPSIAPSLQPWVGVRLSPACIRFLPSHSVGPSSCPLVAARVVVGAAVAAVMDAPAGWSPGIRFCRRHSLSSEMTKIQGMFFLRVKFVPPMFIEKLSEPTILSSVAWISTRVECPANRSMRLLSMSQFFC